MGIVLSTTAPTINTPPVTDQAVPIQKTLAVANTAEDLVLVPAGKKGKRFTIINMGPGAAYVEVDGTATLASIKLPSGATWTEDSDVQISTKFSFIGDTGQTPTVTGVLWAGV